MLRLFGSALLLSAGLLFLLEPLFARMALPLLGGAAAVWTTCVVFYQGVLLAGYLYAHLGRRTLGLRRQALLHLALLGLAALVLPFAIPPGWIPPASAPAALLLLLLRTVALPFFLLAATGPLLQSWFAATAHPRASDPFFLYAASNVGSLAGLLVYPFLLEPRLTLRAQAVLWAVGYGALVALAVGCGAFLLRRGGAEAARSDAAAGSDAPTLGRRLRWLALALVPSSLVLGVTTYLSTDVVAIPLLWVIPLALYLVTFALAFARRPLVPGRVSLALQTGLLLAAASFVFASPTESSQLVSAAALHLLALFVTGLLCHGELAADRPGPERLTEFYLWVSAGGFLGGVLTSLLAPLLFSSILEYPLLLIAAALLRPRASRPRRKEVELLGAGLVALALLAFLFLPGWWSGVRSGTGWGAVLVERILPSWVPYHLRFYQVLLLAVGVLGGVLLARRRLGYSAAVAALVAMSALAFADRDGVIHRERSFYGVHRVVEAAGRRTLYHGSTVHGLQSDRPGERGEPLAYYDRRGPLGQASAVVEQRGRLEVGMVGLGVGAAAALIRPGSRITFFELDPVVVRIATSPRLFSFLADCQGEAEVVVGDARLSLRRVPRSFDLLAIDAFSSDSVPIHLLTREALRLYLERLAPRGILLFHISSRYLALAPMLAELAARAGLAARLSLPREPDGPNIARSTWLAMAREEAVLAPLRWRPVVRDPRVRAWSDDDASLFALLKPSWRWDWLLPWRWSSWRSLSEKQRR